MKLVFYSGGEESINDHLDHEFIKLTGKRPRDIKITYIPSCSLDSQFDYYCYVRQQKRWGIEKIIYFPIDIPLASMMIENVLSSDVIHLAGGNTFYFLKHLRRSFMLGTLKNFVADGGVLTGLSAGAILMTPNILTASFPSFDCDENYENMKNLKALNLCSFEFFPHFRNSQRYINELTSYSKTSQNPLYACPDGHGIVVDDESVKFLGKTYGFIQGKRMLIRP